jgi:hypothetical protein
MWIFVEASANWRFKLSSERDIGQLFVTIGEFERHRAVAAARGFQRININL